MQLEDLPIELLERIAGYLDAHDVTLGLRPSSRLFARVLQRPRVALALSRAVAPSVFASVWGAAAGLGVLSQLASCRRKRFLFLVAASGVLENFKLAMDACGVTRPVFRNIMEAAAFSGSVPLLRWLLSQRGVPEVTDVDILTAAALGGHLPAVQQLAARGFVLRREGLCEGRLAAGGVLRPFPAAAASGNLALVQWLFAQRPCGDTASPGVSRTEAPGRSELLQACVLAAQAGHTNVVEWLCQPARWRRWDPARAATGDLALETGVPEPCWPVDAAQVLAGIAGGCPLHVLQHHFDSLAQPLLEQEQQAGELTQLGLSQTYPWREVMWAFWGRSRCAVRCLHTRCGEKESEAAAAGRRALAPLLRAEVLAAAAASGTQWREKVLFLESQGWGPQDDGG